MKSLEGEVTLWPYLEAGAPPPSYGLNFVANFGKATRGKGTAGRKDVMGRANAAAAGFVMVIGPRGQHSRFLRFSILGPLCLSKWRGK